MVSTKNAKFYIATGTIVFLVGVGMGVLINNVPYVTFKKDVDLGTCISILGLIATIFIMPFIVQRRLSKQDNINSVILIDIEAIHSAVARLRDVYAELKPSTKITKAKYVYILTSFKTISADIYALNKELEERQRLSQFKKDVYDEAYIQAYETCTEPLKMDQRLDITTILSANKALNTLSSELKKYRYETFV